MKARLEPLELISNKGYVVWYGKYGIFGYNHSGTAYGKSYSKIYIMMIYKDKHGVPRIKYRELTSKEMARKRPGTMEKIALQPEWTDGLMKLLLQLREDLIPGGANEEGQKEMTVEQEQEEIETLMAKVGFRQPTGKGLGRKSPGLQRKEI